jgi:hypothetical protein
MPLVELRLQNDRRLAMAMLGLFLVPTLWYLQTDFSVFAGDWSRLTLRLVVRGLMLGVTVAGMLMLAAVRTRASYSRIVFATSLGLAATLFALNALRPEGSDLPIRSPLFTIAVMYGLMPNSTFRQILPPLAFSVALMILRLTWLTGTATSDVPGDVIILMVLNTAGVLMVRRRRALEHALDRAWQGEIDARKTTERALADLKTLHGIIPICSFCKKVRTEGNWQQIERYVQTHTHAEFSHGVCPDCRHTHYPDLVPPKAS